MADIEEMVEEPRTVEGDNSGQVIDRNLPHRNSMKRKRSKKRRDSADSVQASPSLNDKRREEYGDRKDPQPVDIQKEDAVPAREEHKAKFYENYCKVAEEYDKKIIKKYDEDLNTTLIFAGLLSAVTSAFIIQVNSQLQPDPGDETAALLRILIYQINNTALGDNVPTLFQWTGPPHTVVHVQAILFSGLSASLLSAFLAMLGKQWLNYYASTETRGSAIERGQDRQRKLDGINGWYFGFVMESLLVMLQIALLLLGCALSRYLWETSITISLVVLGITSFGLLFYLFILIAGTIWEACPYQTPESRFFRYIGPKLSRIPRKSRKAVVPFSLPTPEPQQTALDLRCISWTLQTSLEEHVRCSTLEHLTTVVAVAQLDPALIAACFNIFVGCISLNDDKVVIMQGSDQLATLSAGCLLKILRHLSTTRPTPSVLHDLSERYDQTFPSGTDFRGLPFYQAAAKIHILASGRTRLTNYFNWEYYSLLNRGLIPFARCMVEAAQAEFKQEQNKRMPCWILRFALHFLSRNPPPPTSVIADCLTIIAVALDHDFLSVQISDESVRVDRVSNLIIQTLETMGVNPDANPIFHSKRKAVSALFPYAAHLSQGGQRRMVDAILGIASKSTFTGFMWRRIGPYIGIARLLDESNSPSWNEAIVIASPFANWRHGSYTQSSVARWAAAVLPTPYSEEVGQSVVDALLQIAGTDSLRPHIPIYIWSWLKRRPSLPPDCCGRFWATEPGAVRDIRGLGDLEILKSYFLLVWSEWNHILAAGLIEMEITIRGEFCGTAMRRHREDLTERLDHVLGRLDQGLPYFKEHGGSFDEGYIKWRKKQYGGLKKIMQEVDRSARETLPEP